MDVIDLSDKLAPFSDLCPLVPAIFRQSANPPNTAAPADSTRSLWGRSLESSSYDIEFPGIPMRTTDGALCPCPGYTPAPLSPAL